LHCISVIPTSGKAIDWRIRAVAFVAAMIAVAGCRESPRDRAPNAGEGMTSKPQYHSAVDEGLGASVAILLDNSGSMDNRARRDVHGRPKYIVAREAIQAMLAATDSFVATHPDFPINVGLYRFSKTVEQLVPISRYDAVALREALSASAKPNGGTAIGDAMDAARADLYRAGTFRKYILVVTDGENTEGRSPRSVAREIANRSGGAVRMYFVAFDVDAKRFDFVKDVRGEVVGASDGPALRASLDTIYRGKILAEAIDIGETLPDSAHAPATQSGNPTVQSRQKRRP